MRIPHATLMIMLVAALAPALTASSVTGKWWNVEAGGSRGNQTISLDLVDKDGKLTGTVKEFTPQPRQILKGDVKGDHFTFETAGLFNGRDVTIIWAGEIVTKDEISVARKFQLDVGRILEAPNNPLKLYREK